MKSFFIVSIFLYLSQAIGATHHQLKINIQPSAHSLSVVDSISHLTHDCSKPLKLLLHEGLNPTVLSPKNIGIKLVSKTFEDKSEELGVEHFELMLPCDVNELSLSYSGEIFHKVKDPTDPYSRGTSDSPGLISEEGVVLSSSTFWYPQFEALNDDLVTFSLEVKSENNFTYMTSGEKISENVFWEKSPQQDIYLIGALFSLYEQKFGDISLSAYLRSPDEKMAQKYLSATEGYLKRYTELIGAYPYKKFDLVENFWDTGFGMPSFTLLGSNIIRLPFIISTSYPHEILHDWWGNSVYVDYNRGNWCEGLTAYLADHLMAELNGTSDSYRRDTLQKFTDFVNEKNDFPLEKFHERNSASTEAIGYGKALMFFHMLRMKVGDLNFKKALNHFYLNNKFKKVSFFEIQKSLEAASGLNLEMDFSQWTKRTGAPLLKISEATSTKLTQGYQLHLKLIQDGSQNAYSIKVPLAITLEGDTEASETIVDMKEKELEVNLSFSRKPIFLQVDPQFDVMRKLAKDEVPSVLTMALGSAKSYFVYSEKDQVAQQKFIDIISQALPKDGSIQIISDKEVGEITSGASIWILGSTNKLINDFNAGLKSNGTSIGSEEIIVNGQKSTIANNSFTLVSSDSRNQNVKVFISANDQSSYEILANKLVHYGKYSFLVFSGDNLINKQKGIWKINSSSMSIPVKQMDGGEINSFPGKLKARGALVSE